jgi:NTE family protein
MLGLAGTTLDAMMRASTRRALAAADVVIDVPLASYGSLDWRRAEALIEEGYKAAEARKADLLPMAVSEAEFEAWRKARQARRKTALPPPAFVTLEGFHKGDAARLETLLARHVGHPVEPAAVEVDLAPVAGIDRYDSVTWRLATDASKGGTGLLVEARPKSYAPPFLMLGLNLENTTSSDFRTTLTARYLTFDVLGSGSELRLDGTLGSEPGAAFALHRPIGSTALFVAPYAGITTRNFEILDEDAILARYQQTFVRAGIDGGVELGVHSDVRAGVYLGRASASIEVGDPGLPELRGKETGAALLWRMDTQDSPVIPSRGTLSRLYLTHVFDAPDVAMGDTTFDVDDGLTQLALEGNRFWSRGRNGRYFVAGGVGTSFDRDPLPTSKFAMGGPFRLGAYGAGELRGSHFYATSGGYFHRIGRLPDFVGGPVWAGGWLEAGDAFDDWSLARGRSNGAAGVVLDTLVGPVLLAGSWSWDGRWRTYIGVGRIVR